MKNKNQPLSLVYGTVWPLPLSPSITSLYVDATNAGKWEKDGETGDQFISQHKLCCKRSPEILQSLGKKDSLCLSHITT